MATWNGSFFEPSEDPSCYSHPDQRNTDPNIQPWNYYPEGRDNTFYGGIPDAYSKNNLALFEQNGSTVFQQIAPSIPPNLVPLANAYHETQAGPAQGENVNYSQCIFENNKLQQQLPPFNCKSGNYSGKQGRNSVEAPFFSNQRSVDPGLAEFSNLHPNAGEFVPYNLKSDFNDAPITINEIVQNVSRFGNPEYGFQDGNLIPSQGPSDVFYGDDRMGWNDKKYVNKKSSHYRQREPDENPSQNENFYRSACKNQYPKNHGKFHSDKYVNRRQYIDNSKHYAMEKKELISDTTVNAGNVDASKDNSAINVQFKEEDEQSPNERSSKNSSRNQTLSNAGHPHSFKQDSARYANRMPRHYNGSVKESPSNHNLDAEHPQVSFKHAKRYFNDDRAERYREKKGSRSDRHDTSYWEKKNSYQDYNGRRGNYEREDRNDKMKDKDRNKDSVREIRDKDNENWRRKIQDDGSRSGTPKRSSGRRYETDDDASQRETLTEQLNRGQLECLVCCDRIKQNDSVWSCSNCYHVLHLRCTKKWARSSQSENGWRCPACQNVTTHVPEDYYCFCGKATDPEWNRRDAAHSCGDMCGRMRSNTECVHKCNLLCHPGPCPPCTAMVTKYCGCGKTFQTLKCSTGMLLLCDAVCGKLLNCTMHECERVCHHGDCGVCEKTVHQECYCGKHNREVSCKADVSSAYECTDVCDKLLECGNHKCTATCHPGSCEPCSLKPETVTHCCCGQTPLTEERKSCLDEIPTCDKTCSKRLKCGQPGNPHTCEIKCHQGDCPECELTTKVKCRCGNMDKEIPCKELTTKADDARCQKRCVKKRSCGRHKCNQLCCIDIEHICPLPCSKTMSCGKHKCEQPCHKGKCQPCWQSSFDELFCECGNAVIYPPVPCGSRRPTCDKPCSRQHGCGHEVLHNCHSEATCPPCTVLTQRWCYGKHELRKAVPCHVNELSCGLSCNKPLSCGRHKCIAICHPGPCEKPGQVCTQPCVIPRELCGHTCAAPCHEGKCPDTPCKEMVKVTCQCGHKSMSRACAENSREYQRIASGILASKMAEMQLGHSVDLEEVFGQGAKKQNQLKTLECNDECKMIERNRRLALGLQIVNPDLSGKLMPRYSDFMKQWAKKDPHFCQMVHDKLTELVQLAKTSKQKSRSYSFESMNRDKRHFVHECCEQFGCESHSYDQEPKRNIVATAVKDKCWLPSLSLLELIQRENGQRRVPGPMLNTSKAPNSLRNVEVLPLFAKKSKKTLPSTPKSPEPVIDYFDYQG